MRRVRQALALMVPALILAGPCVSAGCGPSVQSIYEGDVRFEHCYRLDLELDVAPSHRQACWTSWLDRYTYGQPRDKLEYARRRVRAFSGGDADKPELRVGQNEPAQDARQFYLVVPQPTSVHASPPPIATRVNAVTDPPPAPSSDPSAKSVDKAAPGEECASACRGAFTSCNQACDPSAKTPACKSCDPDYKKCMQRCFD
jgi:hypothetical protein